ncbi:hypothetical protein [Spiroplasma alleghenense]|uniref:hypothetical protein n=1 Tax=Spiroplasma alleghenense TaxID=216931 RepID=UPI0013B36F0C|nr:hypothetical protein [Spiroplasma alleghenense]
MYQKIKKSDYENLFFITTTGQEKRIEKEKNVMVLRSKVKYFNTYYRKIIAELLFLVIFEQLDIK